MIAVLLAIIAGLVIGLLVLASLLSDMRHQRDLAMARETGLRSRLARQPQPRPLVRVTAVLPDKLPREPEPQRALPAGNDGGTIAWPDPPEPRRARDVIDMPADAAKTAPVPVIPIGDEPDGDGSGTSGCVPDPADLGKPTCGRTAYTDKRDRYIVRHGLRGPDWLRWPGWLLAHWPGALEVLRG